ncbi:hypothetical protein [Rubritalea marina]|uniref:hypothetical protein n=1 Tax=Rubritalea marina TaxID=361055 RepID=UPI00037C0284|nr:hypothetical protein [Rubritalea marina]
MDNSLKFDATQTGFSESFYVLWNDPEQQLSMIVRYVLFNGPTEETKIAQVWAWFRDRSPEGKADFAIKQSFPLAAAQFDQGEEGLNIAHSGITPERCWGEVSNGENTLQWDFEMDASTCIAVDRLADVYDSPLFPKFYSPACKHALTGSVTLDQQQYSLEQVAASDGHYWNVHNMHSWSWCNAVQFQNNPDFLFEGIGFHLNDWGQPSVWLTIEWNGQRYNSNLIDAMYHNRQLNSSLDSWEFRMERNEIKFEGTVTAKAEDMILITHPLPDGSSLYTHISYNADLVIHVFEKREGEWVKVDTAIATDTASFEVTKTERNPHVTREFTEIAAVIKETV